MKDIIKIDFQCILGSESVVLDEEIDIRLDQLEEKINQTFSKDLKLYYLNEEGERTCLDSQEKLDFAIETTLNLNRERLYILCETKHAITSDSKTGNESITFQKLKVLVIPSNSSCDADIVPRYLLHHNRQNDLMNIVFNRLSTSSKYLKTAPIVEGPKQEFVVLEDAIISEEDTLSKSKNDININLKEKNNKNRKVYIDSSESSLNEMQLTTSKGNIITFSY